MNTKNATHKLKNKAGTIKIDFETPAHSIAIISESDLSLLYE